jgi:hypothetical protein
VVDNLVKDSSWQIDNGTLALQTLVPKVALPYIGYFDERFRGWGLEDGEYAARIMKLGYPIAHLNAMCYHIEHALAHKATGRDEGRGGLTGSDEATEVYKANYAIYRESVEASQEALRSRHGLIPLQ